MKDSRWIGYKNRAEGDFTQELTERELNRLGYRMVEAVNTPWKVIRNGKRIVGAFPVAKVSGDFRALEPMTGRSVLVEVKSHKGDTLPWSAFEDHQRRALEEHHVTGGISLISWVIDGKVLIWKWPVEGFGPGKSIPMPGKQ